MRVCVFITAGPITKLCAWGEEESGSVILRAKIDLESRHAIGGGSGGQGPAEMPGAG